MEIMDAITAMDTSPFHLTTPSLSSFSSSDLDTESTASSFFIERSTTLGNLLGIPPRNHIFSEVHPEDCEGHMRWSRTSCRKDKINGKAKSWRLLIGCMNKVEADPPSLDKSDKDAPSLKDLLQAQRRARDSIGEANVCINVMHEVSESESSSLLLASHGIPQRVNPRVLYSRGLPSIEEVPPDIQVQMK